MKPRILKNKSEQGSEILEFAAAMPLFLILMAAIGGAVWISWAQAVSDVVMSRAIREATFNRGGNKVSPGLGPAYFADNSAFLAGGETAGSLGGATATSIGNFRMVVMEAVGGTQWSFGPLAGGYDFTSGSAGRYWIFYGGPPDPWE